MKAPILSIVIPVYNVSAYLKKCVLSCVNQDIPEELYEIILVNDGSTDNSLELCEQLQQQYTDIKIISQKNKGLSGARNTGLKHAKGEYVWFVDSDDSIEKNSLGDIIKVLDSNIDLVWLGHDVWFNGKPVNAFTPKNISNTISGDDFFTNHLDNLFYIWKFIYNRDFLNSNKLFFSEGLLYEDLEFTPRALLKADKCKTIPKIFYHYLIREGSIANNIKLKNIEDRFFIIEKLNILSNSKVSKQFKSGLLKTIYNSIDSTIRLAARANINLSTETLKLISFIGKNNSNNTSFKFKWILKHPRKYYRLFKLYNDLKKHILKK